MKITIREKDFREMVAYAMAQRPDEACGLIAGQDTSDGVRAILKVYYLTNLDHTNEHFTIDPREQLSAVKDMRRLGLQPLGNWHSHPETPARPSQEDQRLAGDSKATYLILSLAKEGQPALNAFHIEGAEGSWSVRKEELTMI